MNTRVKLSILLVYLGVVLVFLPSVQQSVYELSPNDLLGKSIDKAYTVSADQVARYIVNEDTTVQIIDLRTSEEYKAFNLPGSINIPYNDLLNKNWIGYLNQKEKKNIFYSNGETISTNAWVIITRLGYENNFIMEGGLNKWYETVMQSKFSGKRISPKENALFEIRYKARRLFTQMNSLPDSMKVSFLEAKKVEEDKLDGGCN